MRSISYTQEGLKMVDRPEPQLERDTDVKIQIKYAGVCGSDLHIYRNELDFLFDDLESTIGHAMGHEASGVVVEVGPKATIKGLKPGDKVTYYFNEHCGSCYYCRNGQEQFCDHMRVTQTAMADYLVVGEQSVYKLPESVSLEKGALIEPISVCQHGIDMIQHLIPGRSVAINGGGAMGLILLQLAQRSGGTNLTLIEPIESKRKIAESLGAMHTFDPYSTDLAAMAKELNDGRGFDVVIEASGNVKAVPGAYSMVGKGGALEFFAALYQHDYDFPMNLLQAFFNEVTIIGGVMQSPYMFPRSLALATVMDLDALLVDGCIFQAEQFQEAFDAQSQGKTIKSLIQFS